jgi:16S rRNA (adenine1518-N6/adenine1519-N6)-dimethyltransferase
MTPTEMRELLVAGGIRLTKSLGQNFLHDTNQLRRIVAAADLKKADRVLEIGPGLGPLTELLTEQAGEVLAIEKDARLVEVLKERFHTESGGTPVLHLLHDDALDYLKREARDWSEWKLVANLPYSVASPILVELALGLGGRAAAQAHAFPEDGARGDARPPEKPPTGALGRGPQRMVATLQIEVAKRLMAKPGNADYGLLTLLVQLDYAPQGWFKIPASCFFPEPDVDSACVCLVRRAEPLLRGEARGVFIQVVKRSFSQRRKRMFKLLKQDWPEQRLVGEFERLKLSPQIRAEAVSLEQFAQLTQAVDGHLK